MYLSIYPLLQLAVSEGKFSVMLCPLIQRVNYDNLFPSVTQIVMSGHLIIYQPVQTVTLI